jgi:hypothetical protein
VCNGIERKLMNEGQITPPTSGNNNNDDAERTKQVTVAGYTAGVSAFFALGCLGVSSSWPTAFGVAAVSAMVAVTCYFILKRN